MQGLWDKAVSFLSANESRIRVETQKISGEEFEVWRWLPACANGGKVWQGQGMCSLRTIHLLEQQFQCREHERKLFRFGNKTFSCVRSQFTNP